MIFFSYKSYFYYFFIIKIYALSTHSYTCQKKNVKNFYNNLGCPVHNNIKLHGAFYNNLKIKSLTVKIFPEYLYDTSIEWIL